MNGVIEARLTELTSEERELKELISSLLQVPPHQRPRVDPSADLTQLRVEKLAAMTLEAMAQNDKKRLKELNYIDINTIEL